MRNELTGYKHCTVFARHCMTRIVYCVRLTMSYEIVSVWYVPWFIHSCVDSPWGGSPDERVKLPTALTKSIMQAYRRKGYSSSKPKQGRHYHRPVYQTHLLRSLCRLPRSAQTAPQKGLARTRVPRAGYTFTRKETTQLSPPRTP